MRAFRSTLLLFIFAPACGSSPSSPFDSGDAGATPEDAMPAADAAPPPPCVLVLPSADALRVSEGGRLRVTLETDPIDASIELGTAPEGWRASIDAEKRELIVKPSYGSRGPSPISLSLGCGASAEVSIEVRALAFTALSPWTGGTDGPLAREHTVMWIAEMNPDRLFLFGGYLFVPRPYTLSWDLWSLDLASGAWSSTAINGEPPHRGGGRIAAYPGSSAIYLSGGDDEMMSIFGSLYRFDYASDRLAWTNQATPSSDPPGAILHAFVYDEPRDRYITACGYTGNDIHCDVKSYNPNTNEWTNLAPTSGGEEPTGRYGFPYAYDRETERLIIFSGAQYPVSRQDPVNPAQDTWALELGEDPPRWVKIVGPQDPPIGRRNGCWALDPAGHRLFAWGGTPDARNASEGLFALDLDRGAESWTRIDIPDAPRARSSGTSVYDPARHRMLFGFGNDLAGVYTDLWALEL